MPRMTSSKLSKKNKWWLPVENYLEAYYVAISYKKLKAEYDSIGGVRAMAYDGMPHGTYHAGSETEDMAIRRAALRGRIDIVESALHKACEDCPWMEPYLLKHVTEDGMTYSYLRDELHMQYGRRQFFQLRRKFYYFLYYKLLYLGHPCTYL